MEGSAWMMESQEDYLHLCAAATKATRDQGASSSSWLHLLPLQTVLFKLFLARIFFCGKEAAYLPGIAEQTTPTPAPLLLHLTSLKGVAMALSVVGKLVSKAFSWPPLSSFSSIVSQHPTACSAETC
jgi:hypothetical protein